MLLRVRNRLFIRGQDRVQKTIEFFTFGSQYDFAAGFLMLPDDLAQLLPVAAPVFLEETLQRRVAFIQ